MMNALRSILIVYTLMLSVCLGFTSTCQRRYQVSVPLSSARTVFSRLFVSNSAEEQEEWFTCTIKSNEQDAIGLRSIDIEIEHDCLSEAYKTPGQYLKLKTSDDNEAKPSFLAIASPPSSTSTFSFLVKETDDNTAFTKAKPGMKVLLTKPQGRGYQIDECFTNYKNDFPVNNVLLLACGSGLAPINAVIESNVLGLGKTGYTSIFSRKACLYIGAKTPLHLPYKEKYADWEKSGIKVVPVISRPSDDCSKDWTGSTGYIQDQLKSDTVKVPRNSAALLCGMRGMTDAMKDLLLDCGVFEKRIMFNF